MNARGLSRLELVAAARYLRTRPWLEHRIATATGLDVESIRRARDALL